MKKLFNAILEINTASFPWYLTIAGMLAGMHYAYPSFIEWSGVPLRGIAWFVGTSIILRGYDLISSRVRPKKITLRLKPVFFSIAGSIGIFWILMEYKGTADIYRTIATSGTPPVISAGLFFILYWCVIVSALREQEDEGLPAGAIKKIYKERKENASTDRLSKESPIRRYAHQAEYDSIASHINADETVLDIGCGDGSLALLLAKKGARVTACDISEENIAMGKKEAVRQKLENAISFVIADAESAPFADNSFDWVVSSHVLEHVPHFEKALGEIWRITKKQAIIAMPTCLNPCAAVILGGDTFWALSRWSISAWFVGCMRIILNLGGDGVDERYAGDERLPHIWHYPWIMRRKIRRGGFRIVSFEASSICMPYMKSLIPLAQKLERYKKVPVLRNCGYGSIAVVEK